MLKKTILIIIMLYISIFAERQSSRGEGLLKTISSNTYGKGNLLLKGFGRAYYWDDAGIDTATGEGSNYPLKVLPSVGADYGITSFLDCGLNIEVIGRSFTIPSEIGARLKVTLPTNKNLRFYGFALQGEYKYSRVSSFGSIGGYRRGGTGFSADGIMYEGSSIEILAINDFDLISIDSKLPVRLFVNTGYVMSLNREFDFLDQILLNIGLEYKGITSDFFFEAGLKTLNLFASSTRIEGLDRPERVITVHALENYIYFSPGVRMKFENGITLTGGFPITLSKEVGLGVNDLVQDKDFGSEGSDGFSPFYADWKVEGRLIIPFKFKTTTSEMVRNYLLLKNVKQDKKRDIDEKVKKKDESEKEGRLRELEDRKKKIEEQNLLE